jgi:hypothetical protein
MPWNALSPEGTGDDEIPPYLDDRMLRLRGWPGHRTLPGKSGLDYLDTIAEVAHMEGIFLHNLVTLRLVSDEPVYQGLLALVSFFGIAPFTCAAILDLTGGGPILQVSWFCLAPLAAVGALFSASLVKSLRRALSSLKRTPKPKRPTGRKSRHS